MAEKKIDWAAVHGTGEADVSERVWDGRGLSVDDAARAMQRLGARYSPDFDACASGELEIRQVRCLMCEHAPCDCQQIGLTFGSAAYFDRLDAMHGRPPSRIPSCSSPDCPLTAGTGPHPRGLAIGGPDGGACSTEVPR